VGVGLLSAQAVGLLSHSDTQYDTDSFHFATDSGCSGNQGTQSQGTQGNQGIQSQGIQESQGSQGPWEFDLQAGDVLYLPTGWFHQVTSKAGRHTAVSFWWRALHWRDARAQEDAASQRLFEEMYQQMQQEAV